MFCLKGIIVFMLKRDIDILDDLIVCGVGSGEVDGAWSRIKKFIGEAQNTSINSAMDAISAIEGAIRIKDIWLPPAGTVDEEHEAEIKALWDMYRTFLNITQKQHQ